MTLEQITALAKEAGLHSALILSIYGNTESLTSSETVELKRIHDFAKLIEAATREECAKRVDVWDKAFNTGGVFAAEIRSGT